MRNVSDGNHLCARQIFVIILKSWRSGGETTTARRSERERKKRRVKRQGEKTEGFAAVKKPLTLTLSRSGRRRHIRDRIGEKEQEESVIEKERTSVGEFEGGQSTRWPIVRHRETCRVKI